MGKIVVIGSMNMDMVCSTNKRPEKGETVLGKSFFTSPGGKGANQAVAAARLGQDVSIISCIGEDNIGSEIINNLINNKIDHSLVEKNSEESSGVAIITLYDSDNSIIVVPGTNNLVNIELVKKHEEIIKKADIVLLQLEIPYETIKYVVEFCYENSIKVLLNPAPAIRLDDNVIEKVTYLTPNEHEYKIIFDTQDSVERVLNRYPNKLIITEGEKGVRFNDGNSIVHIPSIKVDVKDTTGAGDTFNGALAAGIISNKSLYDSLKYAVTASGISVTKMGAQQGMPLDSEVQEYINKK